MPIDRDQFEKEREQLKGELLDYLSEDPDKLYGWGDISDKFPDRYFEELEPALNDLLEDGKIEEYRADDGQYYGVPVDD